MQAKLFFTRTFSLKVSLAYDNQRKRNSAFEVMFKEDLIKLLLQSFWIKAFVEHAWQTSVPKRISKECVYVQQSAHNWTWRQTRMWYSFNRTDLKTASSVECSHYTHFFMYMYLKPALQFFQSIKIGSFCSLFITLASSGKRECWFWINLSNICCLLPLCPLICYFYETDKVSDLSSEKLLKMNSK